MSYVDSLLSQIASLQEALQNTVSSDEYNRVVQQCNEAEDLVNKSQRDNEAKHATIESQKQYAKRLEALLDQNLAPTWKIDHDIQTPRPVSTIFAASTPLPKPIPSQPSNSTLRHSTSMSLSQSKRASVQSHTRRRASQIDFKVLSSLGEEQENGGQDDTPTGAMRKLMASTNSRVETNPVKTPVILVDSSVNTLPLDSLVTPVPNRSLSVSTGSIPGDKLRRKEIDSEDAGRVKEKMLREREEALVKKEVDLEAKSAQLKQLIASLINEAEKRANEREARLKGMIQTAKQESQRY